MIGAIPRELKIGNDIIPIRADYRVCLTILQAWDDDELIILDKLLITLQLLYKNTISPDNYKEAYKKAIWFLDGGHIETEENNIPNKHKLYDWDKDESIIFSAINNVAGKEIREMKFVHWWTFLGYFNEIKDSVFSTVMTIRNKKYKGKKLEKWEMDFYLNNKKLIDLPKKHTAQEQKELEELNRLLCV